MSSEASNSTEVIMIALRYVDRIRWDAELGARLMYLRGKVSRRELSNRTEKLGYKVTHQYIQQIEYPDRFTARVKSGYLTVSLEILEVICKALDINISDVFAQSAKVFTSIA
jgi:hypothetical protein